MKTNKSTMQHSQTYFNAKSSRITQQSVRHHRCLLAIGLLSVLFLHISCDEKASNELDSNILVSSSEPQDYCVRLDKIEVIGSFDGALEGNGAPELYGRICGGVSEDENIVNGALDCVTRTKNCRNFWFKKDDEPFGTPLLSYEDLKKVVEGYFDENVQKQLPTEVLVNMYRWEDAPQYAGLSDIERVQQALEDAEEEKARGQTASIMDLATGALRSLTEDDSGQVSLHSLIDRTVDDLASGASLEEPLASGMHNIGTQHTFRLKDRRNHRVLIVVLPLLDDDITIPLSKTVADDVIYPKTGMTTPRDSLPAVLHIRDKEFNQNPHASVKHVISLSKGTVAANNEDLASKINLHFTVKRQACDNEIVWPTAQAWPGVPVGGGTPKKKPTRLNESGEYTLTVSGADGGKFTIKDTTANETYSCPKPDDASPTCSFSFPPDTNVTITTTADQANGYTAGSWTSACRGAAAQCDLTMDGNKNASRHFSYPTQYCITLEKLNRFSRFDIGLLSGDDGPAHSEPYGHICAIRSSQLTANSKNSISDYLTNCQELWSVKDNDPFSGYSDTTQLLNWTGAPAAEMQSAALKTSQFYNGGIADPDTLGDDRTLADIGGRTLIKGFDASAANDDIVLVFLPIVDDDGDADGRDDIIYPAPDTDVRPFAKIGIKKFANANTSAQKYPALLHLKQSDLGILGKFLDVTFKLERGDADEKSSLSGRLTFEFKIKKVGSQAEADNCL